jgi:hypothetical protein
MIIGAGRNPLKKLHPGVPAVPAVTTSVAELSRLPTTTSIADTSLTGSVSHASSSISDTDAPEGSNRGAFKKQDAVQNLDPKRLAPVTLSPCSNGIKAKA